MKFIVRIIEYFNNNAFITSIITVFLSVGLSAIMTKNINKKEREKNEKREEKINKAKLRVEKIYRDKYSDHIILEYDQYKKKQLANGGYECIYDKDILKDEKLDRIRLPLRNIGKNSIVELLFVVYDQDKNTLVEDSKLKDYVERGWVNFVIKYYNNIRPEECIAVDIYYREKSNIFTPGGSEITVYYKDDYGNYYSQLLFLTEKNLEEPITITKEEYNKAKRNKNNYNLKNQGQT